MFISYWSRWFCFYWYLIFTEWCFWFWKRFKWSTSLLPRFLPTNEKISFFREIPHSPTGRGDFLPTPLIISTRFLVWPWTVSQFSTPKNEFFFKRVFGHRKCVFDTYMEILNLNFKEWKYSENYNMKKCWLLFLSKTVSGRVSWLVSVSQV